MSFEYDLQCCASFLWSFSCVFFGMFSVLISAAFQNTEFDRALLSCVYICMCSCFHPCFTPDFDTNDVEGKLHHIPLTLHPHAPHLSEPSPVCTCLYPHLSLPLTCIYPSPVSSPHLSHPSPVSTLTCLTSSPVSTPHLSLPSPVYHHLSLALPSAASK